MFQQSQSKRRSVDTLAEALQVAVDVDLPGSACRHSAAGHGLDCSQPVVATHGLRHNRPLGHLGSFKISHPLPTLVPQNGATSEVPMAPQGALSPPWNTIPEKWSPNRWGWLRLRLRWVAKVGIALVWYVRAEEMPLRFSGVSGPRPIPWKPSLITAR